MWVLLDYRSTKSSLTNNIRRRPETGRKYETFVALKSDMATVAKDGGSVHFERTQKPGFVEQEFELTGIFCSLRAS